MAYIEGCDCAFCKVNDGRAEAENDTEAFETVIKALDEYIDNLPYDDLPAIEKREAIRQMIYEAK